MEKYEKPVMMLEEIGDEIHTATKDTNGRITDLAVVSEEFDTLIPGNRP